MSNMLEACVTRTQIHGAVFWFYLSYRIVLRRRLAYGSWRLTGVQETSACHATAFIIVDKPPGEAL